MRKLSIKYLLLVTLWVSVDDVFSQEYISDDDLETQYEKPLTVDMDEIGEEGFVELKKKKPKRKNRNPGRSRNV